jgi:hypothetical protein
MEYIQNAKNSISLLTEKGITLPPELFDFIKVIEMGASKYEADGWLKPDGVGTSEKEMHASMSRHLAHSFANPDKLDLDSDLDHLLHLACRALMLYTRRVRSIGYAYKTEGQVLTEAVTEALEVPESLVLYYEKMSDELIKTLDNYQ